MRTRSVKIDITKAHFIKKCLRYEEIIRLDPTFNPEKINTSPSSARPYILSVLDLSAGSVPMLKYIHGLLLPDRMGRIKDEWKNEINEYEFLPEKEQAHPLVSGAELTSQDPVVDSFGETIGVSLGYRIHSHCSETTLEQMKLDPCTLHKHEFMSQRPGAFASQCLDKIMPIPSINNLKLNKENLMKLALHYPIMVGNIDITVAPQETLTALLREVKVRIEENADLAKESLVFKQEAKDLKKIIKLIVKQLDKDFVAEEVSAKPARPARPATIEL